MVDWIQLQYQLLREIYKVWFYIRRNTNNTLPYGTRLKHRTSSAKLLLSGFWKAHEVVLKNYCNYCTRYGKRFMLPLLSRGHKRELKAGVTTASFKMGQGCSLCVKVRAKV